MAADMDSTISKHIFLYLLSHTVYFDFMYYLGGMTVMNDLRNNVGYELVESD